MSIIATNLPRTMNTNPQIAEGIVALHFGPASMDWISKAAKLCGKDAVMDPQVAKMAGANIAAGTPAALAALRTRLEAGAIEHAKQQTRGLGLPPGAAEWLGAGERGVSSETLFSVLTGFDVTRGHRSHPHDLDDFRRCRLLLDAVPSLKANLHLVRAESQQWHNLVNNWDAICLSMDMEAPDWRTGGGQASLTHELIKRAIGA